MNRKNILRAALLSCTILTLGAAPTGVFAACGSGFSEADSCGTDFCSNGFTTDECGTWGDCFSNNGCGAWDGCFGSDECNAVSDDFAADKCNAGSDCSCTNCPQSDAKNASFFGNQCRNAFCGNSCNGTGCFPNTSDCSSGEYARQSTQPFPLTNRKDYETKSRTIQPVSQNESNRRNTAATDEAKEVPSDSSAADTAASTEAASTEAAAVFTLVNQQRTANGLTALTYRSDVAAIAQKKAEDMAANGYFSHTSPTYGSAFDMLQSSGIRYSSAGENIAKGQRTASAVMSDWMNSSGHRANILGSTYTGIGVGCAADSSGRLCWVQIFVG